MGPPTEPTRRSLFDVLQENLRLANKVTFVHRLIYIGEHKFHVFGKHNMSKCIEKTILKVNNEYNEGPLTGILLVYPKYFCHILEGSEDSLYKHFRILSVKQFAEKLGRMKVLVCYHHCNQRFLNGWIALTGTPPTLSKKINVASDSNESIKYISECVSKLYKLAMLCRVKPKEANSSTSAPSTSASPQDNLRSGRLKKAKIYALLEKNPDCLPQFGLIEFLLSTKYTQDLKSYVSLYGVLSSLEEYEDEVWPVPDDFVPFNVFDKPYDPVVDLSTTARVKDPEYISVPKLKKI